MSENKIFKNPIRHGTPVSEVVQWLLIVFAFQRSWALCKMIDLMLKDKQYIALFDFHDDIAILNSENNPTEVHFYELSALTRGAFSFCIFHCFSIAPRTAEKGHEAPLHFFLQIPLSQFRRL